MQCMCAIQCIIMPIVQISVTFLSVTYIHTYIHTYKGFLRCDAVLAASLGNQECCRRGAEVYIIISDGLMNDLQGYRGGWTHVIIYHRSFTEKYVHARRNKRIYRSMKQKVALLPKPKYYK